LLLQLLLAIGWRLSQPFFLLLPLLLLLLLLMCLLLLLHSQLLVEPLVLLLAAGQDDVHSATLPVLSLLVRCLCESTLLSLGHYSCNMLLLLRLLLLLLLLAVLLTCTPGPRNHSQTSRQAILTVGAKNSRHSPNSSSPAGC
jgi:hypothetical protein